MARQKVTVTKTTTVLTPEMMDIPDVEETIKAELPILLQRMFDLAEGVVLAEPIWNEATQSYERRIYEQKPDRQALQFLIENVIGKVATRVEMTGKDGEKLSIVPWMPLAIAVERGHVEDLIEGTAKELPIG